MRFLFLVSIVLFVGACSHKHHDHHDHAGHGDHHKSAEGCNHKTDAEKKDANCGCEPEKPAPETSLENNPKVLKNISQEDFAKVYAKNKEKIGQSCSAPAMKYCGKTTKDLNVTEGELTCLWTKVFRVTREVMPELDGTPCAKMIKGFAKK